MLSAVRDATFFSAAGASGGNAIKICATLLVPIGFISTVFLNIF
jgi:hypothetical protein